jgi:hypothetical protein
MWGEGEFPRDHGGSALRRLDRAARQLSLHEMWTYAVDSAPATTDTLAFLGSISQGASNKRP